MSKKKNAYNVNSNGDDIYLKYKGVTARSEDQKQYIKAILNSRIVFCHGVAGTGKTHVASGIGVTHLYQGKFAKIVITRPLISAGEQTGFLPGDLYDKCDPFFQPIYDELNYYLDFKSINYLIEQQQLEICPLAFMRGRTFKDAFIIADEMQNASFNQIKMLITRIGLGSKMVLSGDTSQSDLPYALQGGFSNHILKVKRAESTNIVEVKLDTVVRDEIIDEYFRIIGHETNKEEAQESVNA